MGHGRAVAFLVVFLIVTASSMTFIPVRTTSAQAISNIPEHFIYWNVLHHVAWLKRMADDAQKRGEDRSSLRHLVHERAGLSEEQGEILESVALQCDADVKATDEKAAVYIRKIRNQYPGGLIPRGFSLPAIPHELDELQQERNQTILRCRDTLRGLLREQGFAAFDDFARAMATRPLPAGAKPNLFQR